MRSSLWMWPCSRYFDAVLCDKSGNPLVVKNAVCMHEEDTGIAWKHVEYRNGRNDMRRGRRLALQFVATVANYDYLFNTVYPHLQAVASPARMARLSN
jgi:Cu2+-containing amine oxidase